MRFVPMLVLLGSASVWAEPAFRPLPLPSPDGKALAAAEGQKTFRVPLRFERVERFYRDRLGADPKVGLKAGSKGGKRTLTLVSHRSDDAWGRAVVREGEVDTTVDVTPVVRADAEQVSGSGRPLVELVFTRSEEVKRQLESIDPGEGLRRR